MDNIIIVGASTTAKTVFHFIQKYKLFNVLGFAVNRDHMTSDLFCGMPVFPIESLDEIINKEKDFLFVAVSWSGLNSVRKKLYLELKSRDFKMANLISPTAIINGEINGDNCWIADLAVIDFGTEVKSNTFIQLMAMIASNSFIEEHSFVAAKATIGGATHIGRQSFVGFNALVFDEIKIGNKSIIGAGTIIKRNVPDYTLCKAKVDFVSYTQYSEEEIESKLVASKNVR